MVDLIFVIAEILQNKYSLLFALFVEFSTLSAIRWPETESTSKIRGMGPKPIKEVSYGLRTWFWCR